MYLRDVPLEDALNIPTKKLKQLQRKGFNTLEDLLYFFPRRYEETGIISPLTPSKLSRHIGEKLSVCGTITKVMNNPASDILCVTIKDSTGWDLTVRWFHQNYKYSQYIVGDTWFFYGKLSFNASLGYYINVPIVESRDLSSAMQPFPVYTKIPGMAASYLQQCILTGLGTIHRMGIQDHISDEICDSLGLLDMETFLWKIHCPADMDDVQLCQQRIQAEILTPFVQQLSERANKVASTTQMQLDKVQAEAAIQRFKDSLSFSLTSDQTEAIIALLDRACSGTRINALVQGDVGCGKTAIAAAIAAAFSDAGYQTAIMAPTTVLADQHYETLSSYFGDDVVLLKSKLKAKERRELLSKIKDGSAKIVVGTHAVLSKDVEYKNLALTIVDEEHRFGVEQRELLAQRASVGTHTISMTATPIPRSLAMCLYGEGAEIFDIHTMPSGRLPVVTCITGNELATYAAMYRQIQQGHQCYVVCPMIDSNDDLPDIESVSETFDKLTSYFDPLGVKVGQITGKMKSSDVAEQLSAFEENKLQILLSTTIVEVGVNVPNATVMVIKNAERFGLAQLHQLRGRVGRSSYQSYCVLLSKERGNRRLQVINSTTDGFKIAQADLELRGAGDFIGTAQSGYDTAVAVMQSNMDMFHALQTIFSGVRK